MAITDEFKLHSQSGRSDPNFRDVVATSGSVTRKKLEVKLKLGRTAHRSHDEGGYAKASCILPYAG